MVRGGDSAAATAETGARRYYGALERLQKKGDVAGVVRVEDEDSACAIVAAAADAAAPAATSRLAAAARTCAAPPLAKWARSFPHRAREGLASFLADPFADPRNSKNYGTDRVRVTWRELLAADRPLAQEMLRLARAMGYDHARGDEPLRSGRRRRAR